jgi:peroxiredoxin
MSLNRAAIAVVLLLAACLSNGAELVPRGAPVFACALADPAQQNPGTELQPRKAPAFTLHLPNEVPLSLNRYLGSVVALEFLLTDCGHCQHATTVMVKLHKEFASRRFQPVAVALDDLSVLKVADFTKRFGVTFPVGIAQRSAANKFLRRPPTEQLLMPYLVLIDRDGYIRGEFDGSHKVFSNDEEALRAVIQLIVSEPAKAPKTVLK